MSVLPSRLTSAATAKTGQQDRLAPSGRRAQDGQGSNRARDRVRDVHPQKQEVAMIIDTLDRTAQDCQRMYRILADPNEKRLLLQAVPWRLDRAR